MAGTGTLWLDRGEMVHALCGALSGEEAVYELLRWRDGNFAFIANASAPARSIDDSWQEVLMEGCRLLDEENARADNLSASAVSAVRAPLAPAPAGPSDHSAAADETMERLLGRIEELAGSPIAAAVFRRGDGALLALRGANILPGLAAIGPSLLSFIQAHGKAASELHQPPALVDVLLTFDGEIHLLALLPGEHLLYVADTAVRHVAILRRIVSRAVEETH